MKALSKPRDLQYNLRHKNTLDIPKVRTASYSRERVLFIGQKLWPMLPPNVRASQLLIASKKELRSCTIKYDCRSYKTFISRVGFFNLVPFS